MSNGRWPLLGSLPSTNAAIAVLLLLWSATGLCALARWNPADRWYQALETFSVVVVGQFIGKRWTNGRGANGNGSPQDAPKT